MRWTRLFGCLGLAAFLAAGCGGAESGDDPAATASAPAPAAAPAPDPSGLTAEELEQGLGPIRNLTLGPIDEALVAEGTETFNLKCSACHKIEERYVGPPLGDVLSRRRPEFVMNMMLNPDEMVARHPEILELLGEFFTPMADQQLTEDDARAVLEYLRSVQTSTDFGDDEDDDDDDDDGD